MALLRNPCDVRRPRNPRFAPEFLERRLSPTDLFAASPRAMMAITSTADDSGPTEPAPPPGDGDPPTIDPYYPVGPSYPA